jgi:hypothetical protein
MNFKIIARRLDPTISMSVFILCAIYIWSWFTNDICLPLKYWEEIRPMQIQHCGVEMITAYWLWWKSHRFKSCDYTKITSWSYSLLVAVSMSYLLFRWHSQTLWNISLLIFILSSLLMFFSCIFKSWTGFK